MPEEHEQLIKIMRLAAVDPIRYSGARLVMAASTRDLVQDIVIPPSPNGLPFTWEKLTAIPVFLDSAVPHGAWRLLDSDGAELRRHGYPQRAFGMSAQDLGCGRIAVKVSFDANEIEQEVPVTGTGTQVPHQRSSPDSLTWSIPADPGSAVNAVRDCDGRVWVRTNNGLGTLWRLLHVVSTQREIWKTLLLHYGPLSAAVPEEEANDVW